MTGAQAVDAGRRLLALVPGGRAIAREHPRHVVLAAVVTGLLAGPLAPTAALALAVVALGLAGRAGTGLLAALAVLGGAALAEARIAARDHGPPAGHLGEAYAGDAVLMEPVRRRAFGMSAARVLLRAGPGASGQAAARIAPDAG
ncbi:MAG TPA: hypothetical protein VF533_01945, partial [Solirubrobacteraceae bacterium]